MVDGREVSIQGSGVQLRWGRSGLDEMAEDSQALLRIGDDWPLAAQARLPAQTRTRIGEPQRVQRKGFSLSAARPAAAYEIHLINLCEQSDPGGAGLHSGHGLIRSVLEGWAEAHSGLRLVVLLLALGSQAQEVRLAVPCTTRSRRVQPITTNQAGASIGNVLQNFDQELCCGEQSGVCAEVGVIV